MEIKLPLHDDHREVDDLLIAAISSLDSADVSQALHDLDVFWARLAMHIRAEHLHLFKKLIEKREQIDLEGLTDIIDGLRHDHDFFMRELSSMIKLLREANSNVDHAPEYLSSCRPKLEAVRDRLEVHNKIEEETIYPLAETKLESGELEALSGLIQKEIDNLPPRLRAEYRNEKD